MWPPPHPHPPSPHPPPPQAGIPLCWALQGELFWNPSVQPPAPTWRHVAVSISCSASPALPPSPPPPRLLAQHPGISLSPPSPQHVRVPAMLWGQRHLTLNPVTPKAHSPFPSHLPSAPQSHTPRLPGATVPSPHSKLSGPTASPVCHARLAATTPLGAPRARRSGCLCLLLGHRAPLESCRLL